MARYLVKQALLGLVKLFLFTSIMFFLIEIVMPYDFVDQFAMFLNGAERDRLRARLGIDLPLWRRYLNWVGGVLSGDLGLSGYGAPVSRIIRLVTPPTLLVFVPGTLISFGIGFLLGKRTAWRGPGVLTGATTLTGLVLFTSFPPWLAWLVAYFLGRQAEVSRGAGGIGNLAFPGVDRFLWIGVDYRPIEITYIIMYTAVAVTALVLIASFVFRRLTRRRVPWWVQLLVGVAVAAGVWYGMGISVLVFDLLKAAAVPVLIYTLLTFGETMTIMQSSMTEVMKEEYVQAARAKGMPDRIVRDRHAVRNALLPVLSRLVISLPYLLAGIVIIEDSLNWPGLGSFMFLSLYWQDIPVVMGVLLFIGLLSLIARLFLDVLTAYLDPRIRFGNRSVRRVE
jgi:peptide/nickel transport system permease protein